MKLFRNLRRKYIARKQRRQWETYKRVMANQQEWIESGTEALLKQMRKERGEHEG